MENFKVAVLGIGGVGGCLAAALHSKGVQVECIVREETAERIRNQGLILESSIFGYVVTHPEITTLLNNNPDILIMATKATHLEKALPRIKKDLLGRTVVIPLLNGLEHMEKLRNKLGSPLAAGSIRIESKLIAPGHIIHSSPFIFIKIASDKDVTKPRLKKIAEFLSHHEIPTQVELTEADVLWDKLVRLVALACTTALTDRPIGWIRSDPYWRNILENVVEEASRVAENRGVLINPLAQMKILENLPPALTSSLQRDIAAGQPSELDAIAGAVVRAGKDVGQTCPTLESLIKKIETKIISVSESVLKNE